MASTNMTEVIPKISVLVITYKQEKIVGRTLDSLIEQRDYLYEICVSDDCSPDGTWDVLLDYQKRFPDLIKLHRQNPNVGIFENTEYTWTMPTGDIVYEIAGDDTTPNGWDKAVVEFIQQNKIDYKNELFCIYGDYKAIYPNGDSFIFTNKAIKKKPQDALRLALRGIIGGRGCCCSINVLKKYKKVSQGRSHIAEMAQDRQKQAFSESNYYIPFVANVYYTGIGVSSHLSEETLQERQQIRQYAENFLESEGFIISGSDKRYGRFVRNSLDFRFHHKLPYLAKTVWYFITSINFGYFLMGNNIKFYVFSILRRLPHKKIINM